MRRRQLLSAATVAAVPPLAGCFSGDSRDDPEDDRTGGDTETDTATSTETDADGDDPADRDPTFRVFDRRAPDPSDLHFNPWNRGAEVEHPRGYLFDPLVVYSSTDREMYPSIARDWNLTDATLDIELREDWTWHDGEPVVAADWTTQAEIELAIAEYEADGDERAHALVADVEAVDDHFLRVDLHEPYVEWVAVSRALESITWWGRVAVRHDAEPFADWHDRLTDVHPEDRAEIVDEIADAERPALEEATGNGAFRFEGVDEGVIRLGRYDDHPHADTIDAGAIEIVVDDDEALEPLFVDRQRVDAVTAGFPLESKDAERLPESVEPFGEGRGSNRLLTFNCGYDVDFPEDGGVTGTPFESRTVRQAVAHLFDRDRLTARLDTDIRPFEYPPCRVPHYVLERDAQVAGVDVAAEFTRYGGNDTERAAELLRREGYERDGGTWLTPDGDPFEIRLYRTAGRDVPPELAVLGNVLDEFGIPVTWVTVEPPEGFPGRTVRGEYHVTVDGSSANGVAEMWAPGLVVDWLPRIAHFDVESEIPLPIGDPDGLSGTKTIHVGDHARRWWKTGDDRFHRELMWWWNQAIPQFEVLWRPDAGAIDTREWELDLPDSLYHGAEDPLYAAASVEAGGVRYTG